jgi:hypothetical protein
VADAFSAAETATQAGFEAAELDSSSDRIGMTWNPYKSPAAINGDSTSSDNRGLRRLIHQPSFIAAWVAMWLAVGMCFFYVYDRADPIPEIDYSFYVRLYAKIGVMSGVFSWYVARLVALKRITLGTLLRMIVIPYAFVTVLALDLNLLVAVLSSVIFGSALGLAYLVRPIGR